MSLFTSKCNASFQKRIGKQKYKCKSYYVNGYYDEVTGILWILLKDVNKYIGILTTICSEYFDIVSREEYDRKFWRMENIIKHNSKLFSEGIIYRKIQDGYFIDSRYLERLKKSRQGTYYEDSQILNKLIEEVRLSRNDWNLSKEEPNFIQLIKEEKKIPMMKKGVNIDNYDRNVFKGDLSDYEPIIKEFTEIVSKYPELLKFLSQKTLSKKKKDLLDEFVVSKDNKLPSLLKKIDPELDTKLELLNVFRNSIVSNAVMFTDSMNNLIRFLNLLEKKHVGTRVSLSKEQMSRLKNLLIRYCYLSVLFTSEEKKVLPKPYDNTEDSEFTRALLLVYNLYTNEKVIQFYNKSIEYKQLIRDHHIAEADKYTAVLRWVTNISHCFGLESSLYQTKKRRANKLVNRQRHNRQLFKRVCFSKIEFPDLLSDFMSKASLFRHSNLENHKIMKQFQSYLMILFILYSVGERIHVIYKTLFAYFDTEEFPSLQAVAEYLRTHNGWMYDDLWEYKDNPKEFSFLAVLRETQTDSLKIKGLLFITNACKGTDRETRDPEFIVIYDSRRWPNCLQFPSQVGEQFITYLNNYETNFLRNDHGKIQHMEYKTEPLKIRRLLVDTYVLFPTIDCTFNTTQTFWILPKDEFAKENLRTTYHFWRKMICNIANYLIHQNNMEFSSDELSFMKEFLISTLRKAMKHSDSTCRKYYDVKKVSNIKLKIYQKLKEYLEKPTSIPMDDEILAIEEEKVKEVGGKKRKRDEFKCDLDIEEEIALLVDNQYLLGKVITEDGKVKVGDNLIQLTSDSDYYPANRQVIVKQGRHRLEGIPIPVNNEVYGDDITVLLLNTPITKQFKVSRPKSKVENL